MEAGQFFSVSTLQRIFSREGRLWPLIMCLGVAAFLWLLTALTRPYKVINNFEVRYANAERFGIKEEHLPKEFSIEIEDYGYNIMGYRFRNKAHVVTIDFSNYRVYRNYRNSTSYILLNNKSEVVARQLSNDARVLKIDPDTLYVSAVERESKKVPVVLKSNLLYTRQYMQVGETILIPDSVTVSGPPGMVSRIDHIDTEELAKENISSPFEERVKLSRSGYGQEVQLTPANITARFDVAEYTEGSIEVPVETTNIPTGASIVLIPQKVQVKYRIPIGSYGAVSAADFKAQADCRNIFTQKSEYLRVTLIKWPAIASNITIVDSNIRYLIKK